MHLVGIFNSPECVSRNNPNYFEDCVGPHVHFSGSGMEPALIKDCSTNLELLLASYKVTEMQIPSSMQITISKPLKRQKFTSGRRSLVKILELEVNPKGKTVKQKYLSSLSIIQEKPRKALCGGNTSG